MIIEVNTKFDSRFVLYDMISVLNRLGSVHVVTTNNNFVDTQWDNNIHVTYVDKNKVIESDELTEDYVIADNAITSVRDLCIYFIDPYHYALDNGDLTLIPKDAVMIKVMNGVGNRIDFEKMFANKSLLANENERLINPSLADEYILIKKKLDSDKVVVPLANYEDVVFFEVYHYMRNINSKLLDKLNTVKKIFVNPYKVKGDKNERSSKKFQQILW